MQVEEGIDDFPPMKGGYVRLARGVVNLLLVCLSTVLTLAVFEFASRQYYGDFQFRNKLIANLDLFRSDYPVDYDPTLGWVPKAGTRRGHRITVLEHGVRSNGQHRRKYPRQDAILAVGDSFTWGYGVSDTATWPSQLEANLHTKVINAGVFGFGVGQTYLRLEQLLEEYKPKTFIFSFIPDDINRAELSYRSSVPKPYFSIEDGELALNVDHLVKPTIRKSLGTVRYVLGFSLLAHKLMVKTFPEFWYSGGWRKTQAHDQGPQVACLLFKKLGRLVEEGKAKQGILLVQYSRYPSRANYHRVDHALECARNGPLKIIDLRAGLEEMLHTDKTDVLFHVPQQPAIGPHEQEGQRIRGAQTGRIFGKSTLDRPTGPSFTGRPHAINRPAAPGRKSRGITTKYCAIPPPYPACGFGWLRR